MAFAEGQGVDKGSERDPASTSGSNDDPRAKVPKLRATCDACQAAKSRCSRGNPCFRCMHHGVPCKYSPSKRIGRPQRSANHSKDAEKEENPPKRKKKAADKNSSSESREESKDRRASISTTPSLGQSTTSSSVHTTSSDLTTFPPVLGNTDSWMDAVGNPQSLDCDTINLSSLCSDGMDGVGYPTVPNLHLPPLDFLDASITGAAFDDIVGHSLNTKNVENRESRLQTPRVEAGQQPGPSILEFNSMNSENESTDAFMMYPTEVPNIRLPLFPEEAALALSNNPSSPSIGCDCYRAILSRLLDFEDSRKNSLTMAIDLILILNRRTQDLSNKVLQCQTHSAHRPDLLLLLAIAIDNVLCILESVLNDKKRREAMSRLNIPPMNLSPSGFYHAGGNSSSMSRAGPPTKGNAKEHIFMKLMESRPLLIDNVEILSDEKVDFGKQFLQRQLSSLSSVVQRLQQSMMQAPSHFLSSMGVSLVREMHRRLHSVIGRLELWEGRRAFR